MCSKLCEVFAFLTFGFGCLTLSLILLQSPSLITTIHDRSELLENQFQLYDAWTKLPLRQTHKFYFFNITNDEQFLRSDAPMVVDEVGPFVYESPDSNQTVSPDGYGVNALSLGDLRFNRSESAGDESVTLYTLNVPLMRRLSSKPHSFLKPPGENLVRQATVRDILREIVDGPGFRIFESFPKNYDSRELPKDASSNYLQYLKNEICLRFFRVVQFVNPPTTAKSGRFFRKSPCDCLVIAPNGTERMGREDPKYTDVLTSKYLVRWDDEKCAESTGDPSVPIRPDRYVTEKLFSLSSAAYWRDDGSVRFDHQAENSNETRIKVERYSDVITDFSFEYQLNIPMKFHEEKSPRKRVNNYPVLRTATSGMSVEDVDLLIYSYIVSPSLVTKEYGSNVLLCAILFMTSFFAAVFLWAYRRISRRINAQRTVQVLVA